VVGFPFVPDTPWLGFAVGFPVGWFRRGFRCGMWVGFAMGGFRRGWVSPWVGFAVGEFRQVTRVLNRVSVGFEADFGGSRGF
jgi:hypothetical protein